MPRSFKRKSISSGVAGTYVPNVYLPASRHTHNYSYIYICITIKSIDTAPLTHWPRSAVGASGGGEGEGATGGRAARRAGGRARGTNGVKN